MTTPIETARLTLRPATARDAAFVLALLNDPGFIANIGDRGARTTADAEAYIEARMLAAYRAYGFGMYVVEARDGGPVGLCGFVRREGLDAPDLGFAFLEAECGKGYGREAGGAMLAHGEAIGIERTLAVTAPHNQASAALLARLGFREVEAVRLPGQDADSRLFERA